MGAYLGHAVGLFLGLALNAASYAKGGKGSDKVEAAEETKTI